MMPTIQQSQNFRVRLQSRAGTPSLFCSERRCAYGSVDADWRRAGALRGGGA